MGDMIPLLCGVLIGDIVASQFPQMLAGVTTDRRSDGARNSGSARFQINSAAVP